MERQRSAIIELFTNVKRQCDIMKLLNIPKERRKFVYNTILRYRETGGVKNRCKSGHPITVMTSRIKKIYSGQNSVKSSSIDGKTLVLNSRYHVPQSIR